MSNEVEELAEADHKAVEIGFMSAFVIFVGLLVTVFAIIVPEMVPFALGVFSASSVQIYRWLKRDVSEE